jgi:hypothetical protein
MITCRSPLPLKKFLKKKQTEERKEKKNFFPKKGKIKILNEKKFCLKKMKRKNMGFHVTRSNSFFIERKDLI